MTYIPDYKQVLSNTIEMGVLTLAWCGFAELVYRYFPRPKNVSGILDPDLRLSEYNKYMGSFISFSHGFISIFLGFYVLYKYGITFGEENSTLGSFFLSVCKSI